LADDMYLQDDCYENSGGRKTAKGAGYPFRGRSATEQ
jgi:hypothetical protein